MQFICQSIILLALIKRADIHRNLNIAYKKCKKKATTNSSGF